MAATKRRPVSAAEQAKREQAREEKLADLHDTLAAQVRSLSTGSDWKRWLDTAAKFPTYSFNNQLLIAAQKPDATAVAGYRAWQALGRQVTKGEKGLAILAPVVRRSRDGETGEQPTPADRDASAASTPSVDSSGSDAERRTGQIVGFRPTYVWDVSQTTGEPLPEPPRPQLLEGAAPDGLWDALASLAADRSFTVSRGDTTPANGYTDFAADEVVIRADVDDAQAVKTLAHELGHVLLHDPRHGAGSEHGEPGRAHGRPEQEVEAESVAYLVAAAHGLPTEDYTFAYVAGWAAGRDATDPEQVVRDTARRVLSAATTVLAVTQPEQAETLDSDLVEHVAASTTATVDLREWAEATRAALHEQPAAGPTSLSSGYGTDRAVLLTIHAHAEVFYMERMLHELQQPTSAVADHVHARGLPAEVLAGYGVGYAPATWTSLTDHLRQLGYSDEQLLDSGLGLRTNRGTVVDRFRNRVMFPVHDVATAGTPDAAGRVIAFIGRSLEPDAGKDGAAPKYLNSPQTALYRKSEHLYGLGAPAVSAALDQGAIPVITEGPWDALAVTAAGEGRHVGVAPGGTALTAEHVAQLDARLSLADRGVVTAFDEDAAGAAASLAAYPLLRAVDAWPTYAPGLPGADPSTLYAEYGSDVLQQSLEAAAARPLANRVTDAHLQGWDLGTAEGTVAATRALARELAAMPLERAAQQMARATTLHGLLPATVFEAYREAADERGGASPRGRAEPAAAGVTSPVALAAAAFPAAAGAGARAGQLDEPRIATTKRQPQGRSVRL
ncbi:DNA primase catalytic core [Motilibacter peucedani]|uniref:DNA primase catalytic core n=1 Tax=Motilibacter peucedani TaxID=598650 RepID=A0A420XV29_9ACTN|nr:ArdC-like ssDNA-binding domain-containing protein [Motilibacter peucedani]RKS80627.1 DNA primase catalytic core [Motilibacter peucedani]